MLFVLTLALGLFLGLGLLALLIPTPPEYPLYPISEGVVVSHLAVESALQYLLKETPFSIQYTKKQFLLTLPKGVDDHPALTLLQEQLGLPYPIQTLSL
ncbi:MAG: hypothetical protein KDK65_05045 [Chlamydiia bacterium]|nr:hypothetical protein [Chlamydiia bacterium]